jgi:hypothetical protein
MTQEWSLAPAQSPAPKPKGKGLTITGAILMLVGVVLVVGGIIGTVSAAAKLVSELGGASTTPTTITKQLTGGTTYAVFVEASGGTGTTDDPFTSEVSTSDISVTGPDGGTVPIQETGSTTQTLDTNGSTYGALVTFTPPTTGQYTIKVGGSGASVLVAPDVAAIGKSFVAVALIPLGVVVGLIGLILLIVGLVRRSSSKRALSQPGYATGAGYAGTAGYAGPGYVASAPQPYVAPTAPAPVPVAPLPPPVVPPTPAPAPAATTPAGWYPDAQRPGGQRYWDGTAWTEHRA